MQRYFLINKLVAIIIILYTMANKLENPTPKLYKSLQLSPAELQQRRHLQYNDEISDPFDQYEIFEMIRHINDPEYPLTLQQLNVVNFDRCYVRDGLVEIHYTPTIPHCSMAQIIGLMIRVKLGNNLPLQMKIKVIVTEGTHVKQKEINKQINDKERVAAAIQNPNILKLLRRGFHNSDRFQYNANL